MGAYCNPYASVTGYSSNLSKLIEYPGDEKLVANYVHLHSKYHENVCSGSNGVPSVLLNGKDAQGYTALHKFAMWDRVELLEMLLLVLSPLLDRYDELGCLIILILFFFCELKGFLFLVILQFFVDSCRGVREKERKKKGMVEDVARFLCWWFIACCSQIFFFFSLLLFWRKK